MNLLCVCSSYSFFFKFAVYLNEFYLYNKYDISFSSKPNQSNFILFFEWESLISKLGLFGISHPKHMARYMVLNHNVSWSSVNKTHSHQKLTYFTSLGLIPTLYRGILSIEKEKEKEKGAESVVIHIEIPYKKSYSRD